MVSKCEHQFFPFNMQPFWRETTYNDFLNALNSCAAMSFAAEAARWRATV